MKLYFIIISIPSVYYSYIDELWDNKNGKWRDDGIVICEKTYRTWAK